MHLGVSALFLRECFVFPVNLNFTLTYVDSALFRASVNVCFLGNLVKILKLVVT